MDSSAPNPPSTADPIVRVRRQWHDYRIGSVTLSQLRKLRWDWLSGGVEAPTPQPFMHGYVWCTDGQGDLAHSGTHGPCPHEIKVCMVKKDHRALWPRLLEIAGPKPR